MHITTPKSVGSKSATAVHLKLPVSFLMVIRVVEQGQWNIIKIIEHLKTYFNDNEINSILNSIQKLTESGNKKIKKLIIEKFLPKLSELSHKNLEKLFLEYKNNPELLELIFEKEKDLVINEKDFLTQNSKFTFFTLVVKNHIFDFKDGFQKFKKLKYFQETLKQVTNIQKFLSEKLFTFSDTKLMHIMIENYVFDNNLVYLHLNSQPPENFVNSLSKAARLGPSYR